MTKKLENLLNLPPAADEPFVAPNKEVAPPKVVGLKEKLDDFDKISAALPKVRGLGELSDLELDTLADKAEKAYDDLMDLGFNVEPKYGYRMFEVAANMLKTAVEAKSSKIEKKLKMVELQIKKHAVDKKDAPKNEDPVEGKGFIVADRNSILQKLKKIDK